MNVVVAEWQSGMAGPLVTSLQQSGHRAFPASELSAAEPVGCWIYLLPGPESFSTFGEPWLDVLMAPLHLCQDAIAFLRPHGAIRFVELIEGDSAPSLSQLVARSTWQSFCRNLQSELNRIHVDYRELSLLDLPQAAQRLLA